jgi:hypothetical protein
VPLVTKKSAQIKTLFAHKQVLLNFGQQTKFQEKKALKELVERNGGRVVMTLSRKVHCLLLLV